MLSLTLDVIVELNSSGFPHGELIWISGKRLQKGKFLIQEYRVTGTVFLLEWGVVEPLQFLADCRVHRIDVKKFPISQSGNDVGSQISNAPLYSRFVARRQYSGGKQCRVIMIR